MGLHIHLEEERIVNVYENCITHNLAAMAEESSLYVPLWRPEVFFDYAKELIVPLEKGLERLKSDPEKYRGFEPDNKWGTYEKLASFVEDYLTACQNNPGAKIGVSR